MHQKVELKGMIVQMQDLLTEKSSNTGQGRPSSPKKRLTRFYFRMADSFPTLARTLALNNALSVMNSLNLNSCHSSHS